MRASFGCVLLLVVVAFGSAGCATAPKSSEDERKLDREVQRAMQQFEETDPSLRSMLSSAYGYAMLPSIGKGGLGVGGAFGRGEVFERGQSVGYCAMKQATIGLQAGGQEYSELIVFESAKPLEHFKSGKLHFSANASAVALKSGAATAARYTEGVAIFTLPKGGLMAEASIGGQQFTFEPK